MPPRDQLVQEGHLRWDSLGEYLATAEAFEELAARTDDPKARALGRSLLEAVGRVLDGGYSPGRKVRELDNRGTNFYVALFWAEALSAHEPMFADLASALRDGLPRILEDLASCQGAPVDLGGYYKPDPEKVAMAMRPSELFNSLIDNRAG